MRKFPIFLALFLLGCGSDGGSVAPAQQAVQRAPEISNLTLSPDSALYMESGGSIQVTAEFAFADAGRDIEMLHVRMSGGTSLSIPIAGSVTSVSGTLTEALDVTTATVHGCTIEIWLTDRAGQTSNHLFATLSIIRHSPEISNVELFPASAVQMEGAGSVAVTADIAFRDIGQDIQTLWIQMPDGTKVEHDVSANTQTGTLTANFVMSTAEIGAFAVEFWLEDEAGDSSTHHSAQFAVHWNAQSSDWTRRLSVPLPLLDVVWDGQVFVAVGYGGTILTSVDGIDWVARESVSDDVLVGLVAVGSDIYAVGGAGILLSTDHGETWTVIGRPYGFIGISVAASSSRIVALGTVPDLGIPLITVSEDFGDTWETWQVSWGTSDLIYRDGLFVTPSGRGVRVSTDGKQWSEIVVDDANTEWNDVVAHDDSKFFVVGRDGTIFSSFDAFNWTELSAPLAGVFFRGAAWNGTRLILAGGVDSYQDRRDGTYRPIGIGSNDGGGSWDAFGIDRSYVSEGIAWGNGRFVSVGTLVVSDEGAIYTTD